jgi:excisionase family DNA binding protein
MTMERRWLTVAETAAYLGIATKSAYDMAESGKLPAAHVGRLVRVDLRALEAELEAQIQGSPVAVSKKGRAK